VGNRNMLQIEAACVKVGPSVREKEKYCREMCVIRTVDFYYGG